MGYVLHFYFEFCLHKPDTLKLVTCAQIFSLSLVCFLTSTQAQNIVSLPDPAALHCIDLGGKLELMTVDGKGERLLCVLANRRIDAWELFRHDHKHVTPD